MSSAPFGQALGAHPNLHSVLDGVFHQDLSLDHQRRLNAYRRYWLFYLGKHWSYVRDPGEPTITMNYARRLLDVLNDFTFKRAFTTMIPDLPETATNEREDREFVRLMLEETWRKNNRPLWCLEAGQQGGVSGDLFVRVSWENQDPLEDPYARADIIPSHLVFPEFGGPTGVDRKKLRRVLVLTPVFEEVKGKRRSTSSTGTFPQQTNFTTQRTRSADSVELVIFAEEWIAATHNADGSIKTPARVRKFKDKDLLSDKVNPLGEIPIVHIPNYPLSGEFYGLSDLVDSAELNRELNEKVTDVSDIINYHSSPVTIVTGAKVKDLERGANRMWGLPDGAQVTNLQLSGDLEAANTHITSLKQTMHELTGVPEQALGKLQAISNTSAVALAIQYLPMMEKRDIKVLTYGMGIRMINRLFMKVTALGDPKFGAKFDGLKGNKYRNDVKFADPLPQDESIELEKARARLDLGLSTRRMELEKRGHSQDEVETIIKDTIQALKDEDEAMFSGEDSAFGGGTSRAGKTQNARGGDPAARGKKVSDTAAKDAAIPSSDGGGG